MALAREFLLIMGLGVIVAGMTTYVIISILVTTHLRDHHPGERARLGANIASPAMFGWYLRRSYRRLGDRTLDALGAPGWLGAWTMVLGVLCIAVSTGMGHVR